MIFLQHCTVALQTLHGILISHRTGNKADLPAAVVVYQMFYCQLHAVGIKPNAGVSREFHFHSQQRQRIIGVEKLCHFLPTDIGADSACRHQQTVQIPFRNIVVDHIVLIIIDRVFFIIFYRIDASARQQDQVDVQFFCRNNRTLENFARIFIFQMVYHQTDLEPFSLSHDCSPLSSIQNSTCHCDETTQNDLCGAALWEYYERQYRTKSVWRLCTPSAAQSLCGIAESIIAFDCMYSVFMHFCSITHLIWKCKSFFTFYFHKNND